MKTRHRGAYDEEVNVLLLTSREAARATHLSAGFLRASNCPKVLIKGHGRTSKSVVRYEPAELVKWIRAQSVKASHSQRRRS
jgi:hypothetical protein